MTKSTSPISQVLWKVTDEFYPQIIVIDGQIQCVSTVGPSDFIVNRLWFPSSIKLISSKAIYENESIVIENLSKLERIESEAFRKTSLNFFSVPHSVKALDVKCFSHCESLSSVRFESGSILSRIEKLRFFKTGLIEIVIPSSVEILDEECFSHCESLSSVRFESGSRLSRIGKWAFFGTGLIEIVIPSSVEVLGERCFSNCGSLSSVTFESGSRCFD
jgi:uncharacterized protein YuzB (UPF0349 family)